MYGENVIAIRTNTNWFKWFKNDDFERWQRMLRPAAVEKRTNREKER